MHSLVYVDVPLISGSYVCLIVDLTVVPQSHFRLKDLGHLRYFLRMELMRESGLSAHSSPTPMVHNFNFTTIEYDLMYVWDQFRSYSS